MRRVMCAALLFLVACGGSGSTTSTPVVDSDKVIDTFIGLYGECYATPGFPQADEATLREAAFVHTARATDDGWVPVSVALQNSGTGQESNAMFRVNVTENLGNPEAGNADAIAVFGKCP